MFNCDLIPLVGGIDTADCLVLSSESVLPEKAKHLSFLLCLTFCWSSLSVSFDSFFLLLSFFNVALTKSSSSAFHFTHESWATPFSPKAFTITSLGVFIVISKIYAFSLDHNLEL